MSPRPPSAAGALHSPMCGAWGCTAAWDTLCCGSATCSPYRTGVAAGARDMLPPQDLLTCSEPLFLPFAFGPHPLGLLLRPPSCPFFCSRLLVPPEPHLHLMISAPRTLSPPGGSGAGGRACSSMCAGGWGACSLRDPSLPCRRAGLCHAALARQDTPANWGTPRPPVLSAWRPWGGDSLGFPASPHCSTRVPLGKGHCWVTEAQDSHPTQPAPGDLRVARFTCRGPLRLPGPGAALAACPPCRAPSGTAGAGTQPGSEGGL